MEKGKGLKKYNLISLVSTPLKAAPFASGVYLLMKVNINCVVYIYIRACKLYFTAFMGKDRNKAE